MRGFIFRCNEKTKDEVFKRKLFGEEEMFAPLIKKINKQDYLFLYNTSTFEFSGPFKPISKGELNIEKGAWEGRFPAQIRFEETEDTKTGPFSRIEKVIKKFRKKIYPEPILRKKQVVAIMKIMEESKS